MYPPVLRYGDMDCESFDSYYERWPPELSTIPKTVVADWIHRHWSCFHNHWIELQPHTWSFELTQFSNKDILAIDHIGKWIAELDAEGVEYVGDTPRSRTPLATHMLTNGTFPVSIIVAKNSGHIVQPRSGGKRMKEPYQLIEGHSRLACIRGMINANHPSLQKRHNVWVVTIPVTFKA